MTNGILLTRHNQEIAQWSPDPFPRERVRSGHETNGLQVQPKCNTCKHADCFLSQGGSGLSFILFPGYGGSNHWAHSRHINVHVATTNAVILTSQWSPTSGLCVDRCTCINADARSSNRHSHSAIGLEKTPPWIQTLPSTSQYLPNYKHSLRILQSLYRYVL